MFQKHRFGDQSIYLCDLLEMPAGKQLERDSKGIHVSNTFGLDAGLIHEDCVTKMRLLSLVGLVTTSSGEISYAVIHDTLKLEYVSGVVLQVVYGIMGCWACYMITWLYMEYRTRMEREGHIFKTHVILIRKISRLR